MLIRFLARALAAVLCIINCIAPASGQATSSALQIKMLAEVAVKAGATGSEVGRESRKLVPADRVVPGDEVIYTLEIRNGGPGDLASPTIARPVPAHMAYVADSATGPGADVTYSIDGGHTFERPENLKVADAYGHVRTASAMEYTHIQWHLRRKLKYKSVAFARFRAVVK